MAFNLLQNLNSEHFRQFIFIFRRENCIKAAKQFWLSKYQQKLEPFEIHNIRYPNCKSFSGWKFWAGGVNNDGIFLSVINGDLYLQNM